jgi:hypothetical protein
MSHTKATEVITAGGMRRGVTRRAQRPEEVTKVRNNLRCLTWYYLLAG